jgi:putative membrane protein
MLIELILAMLMGILAGTFSGLAPGIHINLIGALIVSLSLSALSFIMPVYLVVFIVAMSITHTFVDFIPSIFLGCPNTDTELSILPGHELLKEGKGYAAIMLSVQGCLTAVFLIIILSFPLILLVSKTYNQITYLIPYILIIASMFLVFTEKKKINALVVFILTGLLGMLTLNIELKEPLLPLLTGLFGASSIILSIKTKTEIPKQEISEIKIKKFKPIVGAIISSPLCGFLPGLGSGQAAIIGNSISRTDNKGFLFLLGITNMLVMVFSFLSLYAISKTRTGSAVAIQNLMGTFSANILILILIITIISGIISYFLTKNLARFFSERVSKIKYSLLSKITLGILVIVVIFISGFLGLIFFIISTLTGIYCITQKVKRTNMMGCLLLPTILLYFGV